MSETLSVPDWEIDHIINLVPPYEAPKWEALKLDDEHVGKSPKQQLF